jgi:hypothetical protein
VWRPEDDGEVAAEVELGGVNARSWIEGEKGAGRIDGVGSLL